MASLCLRLLLLLGENISDSNENESSRYANYFSCDF